MAAGTVTVPAGNLVKFFDGTLDLDTDVLKVALFTSSWSTATTAYSTTNEITGDGYTAGGETLTNVSLAEAAGVVKLDADDATWTAGASGLTARYGVVYDDTDTGKTIIGYVLLDDTPADVSVSNGNDITIEWAAAGIVTVEQA